MTKITQLSMAIAFGEFTEDLRNRISCIVSVANLKESTSVGQFLREIT
ncbi:hypothetical protein N8Z04_00575 [bacterium]|nr:hypothetical protein [bacterium]